MGECVFCQHARSDHDGVGCSSGSLRRGRCECGYVDLPPLPPGASIAALRERSDRWHELAQAADGLARELRFDLDRWRPLMMFQRAARQAEIVVRFSANARELTPAGDPGVLLSIPTALQDARAAVELPLVPSAA